MSRTAPRLFLLAVAALSLTLALPLAAHAAEQWATTTVASSSSGFYGLDVSGNRLAWLETTTVADPFRSGGRVFTWKAGDGAPALLSDGEATYADAVSVSGDRVAWAGAWAFLFEPVRHVDAAVYAWTPSAGRSVVATGAVKDAEVDGGRIAWRDDVDPTRLSPHFFATLTWTPGTVPLELKQYHAGPPAVSGDRVAWWDGYAAGGGIWTWSAGGGPAAQVATVPIVADVEWSNYQIPVRLSGSRIVWTQAMATGDEVFTWTPSGGAVQVTHDGLDKTTAEVSGDRIVWAAEGRVFTWTPLTGVKGIPGPGRAAGAPKVSGDRVVWAAGGQVYTWTPRTRATAVGGVRNTGDSEPVVSGNRIAWVRACPSGGELVMTATPVKPRTRDASRPPVIRR